MGTSISTRRSFQIPGATSSDNRLQDVQAIKSTLLQLDLEMQALRLNTSETILVIDGGNASGGGGVYSSGGGLNAVENPPVPGSWTPGQLDFAFVAGSFTPSSNFTF